jgi:hypothetical protein
MRTNGAYSLLDLVLFAKGQSMKGDCRTCKHFEYLRCGHASGGFCHKRKYKSLEEKKLHLQKLDDPNYRHRRKKCFESKYN